VTAEETAAPPKGGRGGEVRAGKVAARHSATCAPHDAQPPFPLGPRHLFHLFGGAAVSSAVTACSTVCCAGLPPRDRAIAEQHEREPARSAGSATQPLDRRVRSEPRRAREASEDADRTACTTRAWCTRFGRTKVVWKLDGLSLPERCRSPANGNTLVAAGRAYANTTGKGRSYGPSPPGGHRSKPLLCAMTQDRGPAVLLSVRRPSAGGILTTAPPGARASSTSTCWWILHAEAGPDQRQLRRPLGDAAVAEANTRFGSDERVAADEAQVGETHRRCRRRRLPQEGRAACRHAGDAAAEWSPSHGRLYGAGPSEGTPLLPEQPLPLAKALAGFSGAHSHVPWPRPCASGAAEQDDPGARVIVGHRRLGTPSGSRDRRALAHSVPFPLPGLGRNKGDGVQGAN